VVFEAAAQGRKAGALLHKLGLIERIGRCTKLTTSCMSIPTTAIIPPIVSLGGISIREVPPGYDSAELYAMDHARGHSSQRKDGLADVRPTHRTNSPN